MISLFTAAHAAIPFHWDLQEGAHHRWVMESQVALPGHIWLYADQNVDVRVRSLRTQLVVDCTVTNGGDTMVCVVEDAALSGETYASERGLLQPVLDEIDAKLTGARVELELRGDGRLRGTKVELLRLRPSTNRRTRHTAEMMRVLVQRTFAPLDLQIPRRGLEEGGWPQYHSTSLQLLTLQGTAGGGKLVHHAQHWGEDRALVATAGRATLIDGATMARQPIPFDTTLTGHTVLDTRRGTLAEARWEIYGEPTASAGVTVPYQATRIQIRALGAGEPVLLGATEEWSWEG